MLLDVKQVMKEAEEEVREEAAKEAKKKIKIALKAIADAEKILANAKQEYEVLIRDIGQK